MRSRFEAGPEPMVGGGGCTCAWWKDLAGFAFPRASFSLECWIHPCLSEIDKAMEKVRLWLGIRREAWRGGKLETFLPSQEKSVLYLTMSPPSPPDSGTHASFPQTDFVA